ncbi:MAG: Clp protease ClpP [Roseibium sp.]|nr:Clp protease ClpP [Roseibium sp.]
MTMYLRLGGRPAVDQAVRRLVQQLAKDTADGARHAQTATVSQDDLAEFFIFLFGGAPIYDGPPPHVLIAPICPSVEAYPDFIGQLVGAFGAPAEEQELRALMDRALLPVLSPPNAPSLHDPEQPQSGARA